MADTSQDELFLLGACLSDNKNIEWIAKEVSVEEFGEAHQPIFDTICRLWVKAPKNPITTTSIYYTAVTLTDHKDQAGAWQARCQQGVKLFESNGITIQEAAAHIHDGRRLDRFSALLADFIKHKDRPFQEVSIAICQEILRVLQQGVQFPKFKALRKTMSDPPVYKLLVSLHGEDRTLRMTYGQLENPKAIEGLIFQHFNRYPDYKPGAGQWKLILSRLGQFIEEDAIDEETPNELVAMDRKELTEIIEEYLDNAKRVSKASEVVPRTVLEVPEEGKIGLNFRDLFNYCRSKGVTPANTKLGQSLSDMGFKKSRLGTGRVRLWSRTDELV
ncbi:hypothetical protein [Glutamicibacter sp.]|jgi:Replicative DNA helicase|uniref:hypothetical protein n=1 Tax=Glutamicibacter sp. TaxID=1931995 RepID=UPI002FD977A6